MDAADRLARAREIMDVFARSTGLSSDEPPRRYLWTDAFAVCNYLGLHEATGEARELDLALALVDQVHHVLGRHRPDDERTGWISGLADEEGERHPTAGGLRIGKGAPERGADERYDPHREWDRDGQYYHYLTRWMHALDRVARVTGDATWHRWAVELARAAHAAFVYRADGQRRMRWKMSIDLSRPLVPTQGAHDPLDGWVTASVLAASGDAHEEEALAPAIAELAELCRGVRWATSDPLGLGGLLVDTDLIAGLIAAGARLITPGSIGAPDWLASLLDQAAAGLSAYVGSGALELPARSRLAFRDLGLAIGLSALARLRAVIDGSPGALGPLAPHLDALLRYGGMEEKIVTFWLDPSHRGPTWTDHVDINRVMLATALAPSGYLGS